MIADVDANEMEDVFAQDGWFDDHQAICIDTLSATAFNNNNDDDNDDNNNNNNNTATVSTFSIIKSNY